MKHFIFMVTLSLLCALGQAQMKATTEDGREVVLHDDGTWEFVDPEGVEQGSSENKINSLQIIKEHCEGEWPTDFQMQSYCRDKQTEAARKLAQGKPSDVSEKQWNQISGNCWAQWENDFQMTEYCIGKQVEALRKLR